MLWTMLLLSLAPVDPVAAPATISEVCDDTVCAANGRLPECGPGVWLGPLAICKTGLVETRLVIDEYSGMPSLIIDLDGELRDDLAKLTAEWVGQQLPLRIDGRALIAPIVHEPITAGSLQVWGSAMAELEGLQTALQKCAGAAPVRTAA